MQKVVIFGAGNCGRLIGANLMQDKNVEIIAFIDNDPQKAGQRIYFENTQDSVVGNFDNTDSKAEVSLSDFSGFQTKGEGSYLKGNDRALSEDAVAKQQIHTCKSAKSTKGTTPHNHGGGGV